MNKLNTNVVGLTLGTIATVLSLICAVFYITAPNVIIAYFSYLFHGLDLSIVRNPSLDIGSIIIGLLSMFITGYLVGALFAGTYNYFNRKHK